MSKFVKTLLITIAANTGVAALLCIPIFNAKGEDGIGWLVGGLVILGLALLVQLVIGIAFVAGTQNKETGKGMLLAVGIILLIGLSICGGGMIMG